MVATFWLLAGFAFLMGFVAPLVLLIVRIWRDDEA
jgi:hypothetical protein